MKQHTQTASAVHLQPAASTCAHAAHHGPLARVKVLGKLNFSTTSPTMMVMAMVLSFVLHVSPPVAVSREN